MNMPDDQLPAFREQERYPIALSIELMVQYPGAVGLEQMDSGNDLANRIHTVEILPNPGRECGSVLLLQVQVRKMPRTATRAMD